MLSNSIFMKTLIATILLLICTGCSVKNGDASETQKSMIVEPYKAETHMAEIVNDNFISAINMPENQFNRQQNPLTSQN